MATSHPTTQLVFVLADLCSLHLSCVLSSYEFQVGDHSGWTVPTANHSLFYNHWASDKRFRVGDTILFFDVENVQFKYNKDSVMEVREAGYNNCNSTRPKLYSNNGNTVVKLDHQGFYYFISGAEGHCEKGQKMIVQVMAQDHQHPSDYSSSSAPAAAAVSPFVLLFLAASVI